MASFWNLQHRLEAAIGTFDQLQSLWDFYALEPPIDENADEEKATDRWENEGGQSGRTR